MKPLLCALTALFVFAQGEGWSMDATDIPAAPPDDAVMAGPDELARNAAWIGQAFEGRQPQYPLVIDVRRQDHSLLRFGRSCMDTPIRIGTRDFAHGLGTHANSEIAVALPEGARRFEAFAGIDNNPDTGGTRGSVVFSVAVDDKELARTPVLKGPDAPYAVAVDIPPGARELVLRVETTDDGPAHDQADWADARLLLADGSALWLDEGRSNDFLDGAALPFSFVYGGKASREFLGSWKHDAQWTDVEDGRRGELRWTDPQTGLVVTAEVLHFSKYPAVEWVLHFENTGTQDTPLIEDVQALDATLFASSPHDPVVLRRILGDACNEKSFLPAQNALRAGEEVRFAPTGGRSSSFEFPFFDVQYRDSGLIAAVGWTGQWAVSFAYSGANRARLCAGMELTRLALHPGERIRTPRILLMTWNGDTETAHNRFRRLMLFHYAPKRDGRPVQLPVVLQCFDRYSWTVPEWATERGQIEAVEAAHALGFDAHWLDAAWFVGGFPNGVGNWYCKPAAFPNGLKPVADACHARGMRFVVWFEPERVAKGSQIALEHPEFVHGGADGGLFKLDDPAARRWLTDLLSQRIEEFGIDVYRNDFNMDPLDRWRRNDEPGREGITEIRYIEGLYEMWDELLARHPGLLIDNCSSGGRRIDLEMCSRSVPFWRSDTNCTPGHADWDQAQTAGLGLYVPLHMSCAWTPDAYTARSSATAGAIAQWDYRNAEFDVEAGKASTAEAKAGQKYWYGDFYPLFNHGSGSDAWSAFQFHRADLDEGMVLVFRRKDSPYTGVGLGLRALRPDGTYRLRFIDDDRNSTEQTLTGRDLSADWEVRMPEHPSSLLIRYRGE